MILQFFRSRARTLALLSVCLVAGWAGQAAAQTRASAGVYDFTYAATGGNVGLGTVVFQFTVGANGTVTNVTGSATGFTNGGFNGTLNGVANVAGSDNILYAAPPRADYSGIGFSNTGGGRFYIYGVFGSPGSYEIDSQSGGSSIGAFSETAAPAPAPGGSPLAWGLFGLVAAVGLLRRWWPSLTSRVIDGDGLTAAG